MAAAHQHEVLELRRRLHPVPYSPLEGPLVRKQKILYINALFGFLLVILEVLQWPFRPASPFPADRPAGATARSPWALSWPLALGLTVFVCLLNIEGLPLLADPDSHWHIAVGKWILENGTVPTVDIYSLTFLGQPWIAKEWLSQILLAGAYDMGGWGAVMALCAAAIGVTFALLLRLLLRDLRPLPAMLFTIAAIVMTAPHFLARPHVLAFPFMLLWVAGLVRAVEERRAPEPMLLLAMLLWANLHGGFTLGLMLCGAFALEAVLGARDKPAQRRCSSPGRSSASHQCWSPASRPTDPNRSWSRCASSASATRSA